MSIRPILIAMVRGAALALYRVVLILIVCPILWLIEPIWRLRFTHLWCARFGPLAYNTHLWLGTRALEGPESRTTRIFFGAKPANQQLFTMWARVLPVIESRLLSACYHHAPRFVQRSRFFAPLPQDVKSQRPLYHQPGLAFTPDEMDRGQAALAEMGIPEDAWWVCFQGRDPNYHLQRGFGDSGSHRDCRVENYLKAAKEITARGGWAVRVGAKVDKPLPETGDPRIVDYATRFRSDFADIYLLARCRFVLVCGTGTESIPPLFGRPVAKANMLPLRPTPVGANGLYIPKLLHDTTSGADVTYARCAALGAYEYEDRKYADLWDYPGGLEKMGLRATENDPDDIWDLCLDMFDLLDGVPPPPEGARLQALYQERFFSHVPDVGLMARIGPRFASKYRHLIED